MKYQKIDTLFKRDERNVIIPTEYCRDEFKYLENLLWECTEKIDGTNMRVTITPKYTDDFLENINVWVKKFEGFDIKINGKSDDAIIPKHLLKKMEEIFTAGRVYEAFAENYILLGGATEPNYTPIILYGEGYGVKIQKGGNYLSNDVDFILFDVKIGNFWLKRADVEDIASKLNIKVVPFIGLKTIPQAIEYVKKGFVSNISENRNYMAEGLVLRTPCGLMNRKGERIIVKIKYKDFQDLYRKTPKKYQIFKRVDENRYECDEYVDCFIDKKIACEKLKEYKSENPTELYLIKEMNSKTNEVYHEIFE